MFFFLSIRRPPRSTRTDTPFPYPTLFRSVTAGVIAFMLAAVREAFVARGPDVHHLAPLELEQDVVLGVEMERRDRPRRRDDDEAMRRQTRAGAGAHDGLEFAEAVHQQGATGGHILDIFETDRKWVVSGKGVADR